MAAPLVPPGLRLPVRYYGWVLCCVLPVLVTWLVYYPRLLRDGPGIRTDYPDTCFYVFQMQRMAEVDGRWWQIGQNVDLGAPYSLAADNNPGLYEGVDLIFVSWLTGQFFKPVANLHVIILLALAFNVLVASLLVWHLSKSPWLGALSGLFTGLNYSTLIRMEVHLHLFKFGWIVLALWLFFRWLDRPTWTRAAVAGVFGGMAVQGSLYLGYFLGLAVLAVLGFQVVRNRIQLAHLKTSAVAGLVFVTLVCAMLWPVVAAQRRSLTAGVYKVRMRSEIWTYASELWQYFTPPQTGRAAKFLAASGMDPGAAWGAWHYLGITIPLTVVMFFGWRWRRRATDPERSSPATASEQWALRFVVIAAVFLVLSLRGGPSVWLFSVFPSFRCYGRAGALAVACLAIAVPLMFHWLFSHAPSRLGRIAMAVLLGITLTYDLVEVSALARRRAPPIQLASDAPWVDWLQEQPPETRLIAISGSEGYLNDYLQYTALEQHARHRHHTLNGCNVIELHADLRLLGCTIQELHPGGLLFLCSLGYNTLAIEEPYLNRHPWIRELSWLEIVATENGWTIYRVLPSAPRFAGRTPQELAELPLREIPVVPAGSCLTQAMAVDEWCVITEPSHVSLCWTNEQGQPSSSLYPVFRQHVVGPGLAAWSIPTPSEPGVYQLEYRQHGQRVGRPQTYRVEALQGWDSPGAAPLVVRAPERWHDQQRVRIENHTDRYLSARPAPKRWSAADAHPALAPWHPRAWQLLVRSTGPSAELSEVRWPMVDLPPHAVVEFVWPPGCRMTESTQVKAVVAEGPVTYATGETATIIIEQ